MFEIKPHGLDKTFEGLGLCLVLSNDLRQCYHLWISLPSDTVYMDFHVLLIDHKLP